MIAALPMYDLPEIRWATDTLWAAIRDRLRAEGIAAPEALTRGMPAEETWAAPVLSQTCGLPWVRHLRGRLELAGTPDYGIEGCPPGWYRSAVVVREDDARASLSAFRGARLAVNGPGSQSGTMALMHHVEGRHFGETLVTGAHEASARAVAEGRADLAAIDAVTWALLGEHRPVPGLRVLMLTEPAPGLPFVSVHAGLAPLLAQAVQALEGRARRALRLRGVAPLTEADYDLIAERDRAGHAAARAHGLAPAAA